MVALFPMVTLYPHRSALAKQSLSSSNIKLLLERLAYKRLCAVAEARESFARRWDSSDVLKTVFSLKRWNGRGNKIMHTIEIQFLFFLLVVVILEKSLMSLGISFLIFMVG